MQASPLVGAPCRRTSNTARSSSGPYSEPYLICKSNLIFGALIEVEFGCLDNSVSTTPARFNHRRENPSQVSEGSMTAPDPVITSASGESRRLCGYRAKRRAAWGRVWRDRLGIA